MTFRLQLTYSRFIFADDTSLFSCERTVEDCIAKINLEMESLLKWIRSNKLSLNIDKTNYIIFSKSARGAIRTASTAYPPVTIDGIPIKHVHSIKFLGVFIDDRLSWHEHVRFVRGKVSRSLGVLRRAQQFINRDTLISLYYSFLYPYLNYCIDVWGHCAEHLFNSLFILQKSAIRIINSAGRRSHTAPLFTSMNILPLRNVYFYSISLFMFKFYSRLLPIVVDELFQCNPFTMSELDKRTYYTYRVYILILVKSLFGIEEYWFGTRYLGKLIHTLL